MTFAVGWMDSLVFNRLQKKIRPTEGGKYAENTHTYIESYIQWKCRLDWKSARDVVVEPGQKNSTKREHRGKKKCVRRNCPASGVHSLMGLCVQKQKNSTLNSRKRMLIVLRIWTKVSETTTTILSNRWRHFSLTIYVTRQRMVSAASLLYNSRRYNKLRIYVHAVNHQISGQKLWTRRSGRPSSWSTWLLYFCPRAELDRQLFYEWIENNILSKRQQLSTFGRRESFYLLRARKAQSNQVRLIIMLKMHNDFLTVKPSI